MKSLSLEIDDERFTVQNLKECFQMMLLSFFWIIENIELHVFTWLKYSRSWLDVENLVIKDVLLKSFLLGWFSWIGPRLHLNLRIVW